MPQLRGNEPILGLNKGRGIDIKYIILTKIMMDNERMKCECMVNASKE